jgi:CubicO group peptidase (beta-lactamase class C family)
MRCFFQNLRAHLRQLLFLVWTAPVVAQPQALSQETLAPQSAAAQQLQKQVQSLMNRYDIVGGAIAIVKDGRAVDSCALGYADLENNQPVVAESSIFRIASISKSITAACILKLVEEGKLRLEDKAFELIKLNTAPKDARVNDITVLQLLNMTAGWDKRHSGDPILQPHLRREARHNHRQGPPDFDTMLDYVVSRPLDFSPGSKYVYSNFAYGVLGKIVEQVSGQSYETFAREKVFQPCSTNLTAGRTKLDERQPNEVVYYSPNEHKARRLLPGQKFFVERPYGRVYLEADLPMAGWLATAPQLAQLLDKVCAPQGIVGQAMADHLFVPPEKSCWQGPNKYFCCGFELTRLKDDRTVLYKDGTLPGTRAFFKRTADGITWVALFNGRPAPKKPDKFALDLDQLLDKHCRSLKLEEPKT